MNIEVEVWISIIAVAISFLSLLVTSIIAWMSWHRSRVIYGLEEFVLRKIDGSREDDNRGLKDINSKLKTGEYIIQGLQARVDGDWAVILARVKK